jgi:hypothetical protein
MIAFLVFEDSIGCQHVAEVVGPHDIVQGFCGHQVEGARYTVVYTLPKDRRRLCRKCFACFDIDAGPVGLPGSSIEPLMSERCNALRGPEHWQPSCDLDPGHEGPHRWKHWRR